MSWNHLYENIGVMLPRLQSSVSRITYVLAWKKQETVNYADIAFSPSLFSSDVIQPQYRASSRMSNDKLGKTTLFVACLRFPSFTLVHLAVILGMPWKKLRHKTEKMISGSEWLLRHEVLPVSFSLGSSFRTWSLLIVWEILVTFQEFPQLFHTFIDIVAQLPFHLLLLCRYFLGKLWSTPEQFKLLINFLV